MLGGAQELRAAQVKFSTVQSFGKRGRFPVPRSYRGAPGDQVVRPGGTGLSLSAAAFGCLVVAFVGKVSRKGLL